MTNEKLDKFIDLRSKIDYLKKTFHSTEAIEKAFNTKDLDGNRFMSIMATIPHSRSISVNIPANLVSVVITLVKDEYKKRLEETSETFAKETLENEEVKERHILGCGSCKHFQTRNQTQYFCDMHETALNGRYEQPCTDFERE